MFEFNNTLLIIGGAAGGMDGSRVYQLEDPLNGDWIKTDLKLKIERSYQTAFLVPDYIASCD
jgi:hypothetical protein